jgi:hypothetical protein
VSMHHAIQIHDKPMGCGWMWLTAWPTHLPFHIVQSQLATLNVAGKMWRNAKFWVKMLQLMEHRVIYCGHCGWRITHNKDVIKGCHYATHSFPLNWINQTVYFQNPTMQHKHMCLTFSLCIKMHKINTMQRQWSSHPYVTLQPVFYYHATEEITRLIPYPWLLCFPSSMHYNLDVWNSTFCDHPF